MSGIEIRTVINRTLITVEISTVPPFLVLICPLDSIKESSNIQPPFSKFLKLFALTPRMPLATRLRQVSVTGSPLISMAGAAVNPPLVLSTPVLASAPLPLSSAPSPPQDAQAPQPEAPPSREYSHKSEPTAPRWLPTNTCRQEFQPPSQTQSD